MPLPTENNPSVTITYDELVTYGTECANKGQHQGVTFILDFVNRNLSQAFEKMPERNRLLENTVFETVEEVRELFRLAGEVKNEA